MSRWIRAAQLIRAKGTDGRFVARCAPGLSLVMAPGTEVAFVPPCADAPRRGRVTASRPLGPEGYEIAFNAVRTRSDAEKLAGCFCLMHRDEVPEGAVMESGPSIVGYAFVTEDGVLGIVSAVEDNPGQRLIRVERPEGGPFHVPFVDAIVRTIDESAQRVEAELPPGLLEL